MVMNVLILEGQRLNPGKILAHDQGVEIVGKRKYLGFQGGLSKRFDG